MIPEGWRELNLSSISTKIGDGIHATPKYDENGSFYFINGNNINEGKLVFSSSTKKVGKSEFEKYKLPLSNRTILMSINGTIGSLARYREEAVILGKSAAYITVSEDFCEDFIFHVLSFDAMQNHFMSELTGSTIKNLSLKTIRNAPLIAPQLPEQRRISEILSTWDRAIETMEALIINARAQKQALMQSLLPQGTTPPKKRLPDFSGGCQQVTLEQIAGITMGSSPPSSAYNELGDGLPLIQGNADVKNRISAPRVHTSLITQICEPGDILFSVRAPVGEISRSIHQACIGRGVAAIRAHCTRETDYLYFLLLNEEPNWVSLSQGSTFQAVNSQDLKKFMFSAPKSSYEREAIGRVLRDAQSAEDVLHFQLSALREEKSALMQQLLTGKRRVKVDLEGEPC